MNNQRGRIGGKLVAIVLLGWILGSMATWAAPFAKRFAFTQPDGTTIELWGEGDEFRAVFETLDGYTVRFDPPTKSYQYARLSADGNALELTGALVGKIGPQALGLQKHLRINPAAAKAGALTRRQQWEQATQINARWQALKAARQRTASSIRSSSGPLGAPPTSTTTGTKVGLCLLVDFSDDTNTVAQAEIVNFCNGTSYTGHGNNGSVRQYFHDVSNGLLTYTNVVPFISAPPAPRPIITTPRLAMARVGATWSSAPLTPCKRCPTMSPKFSPPLAGLV